MSFLIDTNIFLEILLHQDKNDICKDFLKRNIDNLFVTDFSLHSIGVIIFRQKKEDLFSRFVEDTLSNIQLLSLPRDLYSDVVDARKRLDLDFDDAYQYSVCKHNKLTLVTMDHDFEGIHDVNIQLL